MIKATFFLLSFLLAVGCVRLLKRIAPRIGLIDLPNARKQHAGAVPLVGGLAMFVAFVTAAEIAGASIPSGFMHGAALLVAIGALDDRRPLPAVPRLLVQTTIITVTSIVSANVLVDLGELLGPWTLGLGLLAIPFSVVGMLGVLNAMNFTDGADGLAGGVALTALLSFGGAFQLMLVGTPAPPFDPRPVIWLIAGAVAGFLVFNLRTPLRARAEVFMGDAGSLFLGFVLGWLAIYACSHTLPRPLSPVTALWILIVPLFDTIACMIRRKRDGLSPMRADRQHLHHLLQNTGLSPARAVVVLIGLNAAGGAIGVASWWLHIPDYFMFATIVGLFATYLAFCHITWERLRRRLARPVPLTPVHRSTQRDRLADTMPNQRDALPPANLEPASREQRIATTA